MYIVTGGAGFIGSNLVHGLNARGVDDILVVDDLTDGQKFRNLRDSRIADYIDKDDFVKAVAAGLYDHLAIEAIFHQGACSDTTNYDGVYMMRTNYEYSKTMLEFCLRRGIPFVYASSAATYGDATEFAEARENERPLNVYGYSKLQFDRYVQAHRGLFRSTVVGLRYFNVYGPHEWHKGKMASMPYQLFKQLATTGKARLFTGTAGYGDGEQRRDFVWVRDVVDVNLFFADGPVRRGVFNCGTGQSRTFNDIARGLIAELGTGSIEYVPFPPALADKYQSFTEADPKRLLGAGYKEPFHSLEEGIRASLESWRAELPLRP